MSLEYLPEGSQPIFHNCPRLTKYRDMYYSVKLFRLVIYSKPRISRTRVSRIFAQLGQNAAVPMMLIVFSTTNLG